MRRNEKDWEMIFFYVLRANWRVLAVTQNCIEKIHGDIRRILIDRFPFGIFFIENERHIAILAVLHARRNPNTWRGRT
jgi:plasmid stabilization system protein ParE